MLVHLQPSQLVFFWRILEPLVLPLCIFHICFLLVMFFKSSVLLFILPSFVCCPCLTLVSSAKSTLLTSVSMHYIMCLLLSLCTDKEKIRNTNFSICQKYSRSFRMEIFSFKLSCLYFSFAFLICLYFSSHAIIYIVKTYYVCICLYIMIHP